MHWSVCLLLILALSCPSLMPMTRSVCCIGSNIVFLCGMVRFATGLKGWVDSSRFSVNSDVCIVIIANTNVIFVVAVRVGLATAIILAGSVFFAFVLVFLFFDLTALVSIVAWFFPVMTCQFGFFSVRFCGVLHQNVQWQLFWGF